MNSGRPRLVLVVNPRTHGAARHEVWRRAAIRLTDGAEVSGSLETRGDGTDVPCIEALVRERQPDVVVAAGGDGTVNEVTRAILRASVPKPPALAIVPLGTGNNVARALGLSSCRSGAEAALTLAVDTALAGNERRIDVGLVNERCFLGSFAIGMDADILRARNRARTRLGLRGAAAGYALYLCSCALNLLRPHGAAAKIWVDGAACPEAARPYNLLIANTPIYAGEFRFVAQDSFDDGRLDLVLVEDALQYLRSYPAAWRRHVRSQRGDAVRSEVRLRQATEVTIELARALPCQIDGEEGHASASYHIRVLPRALTVRMPDARD